jgi:hypothetical protein
VESLGLPRFIAHLGSGFRFRIREETVENERNNSKMFSLTFLSRNASGSAKEIYVKLRTFDVKFVAFLSLPTFTGKGN